MNLYLWDQLKFYRSSPLITIIGIKFVNNDLLNQKGQEI